MVFSGEMDVSLVVYAFYEYIWNGRVSFEFDLSKFLFAHEV